MIRRILLEFFMLVMSVLVAVFIFGAFAIMYGILVYAPLLYCVLVAVVAYSVYRDKPKRKHKRLPPIPVAPPKAKVDYYAFVDDYYGPNITFMVPREAALDEIAEKVRVILHD